MCDHYFVSTRKGVVLSASDSSGNISIWSRLHDSGQFELVHSVTMPPSQTPHVLHLVRLDEDDALCLLIGAVDSKIHVWATSTPYKLPSAFEEHGTLSGHDEWVTSLSSRKLDSETPEKAGFLLASGSKDFKTRVWRFEPEAGEYGVIEGFGKQPFGQEEYEEENDGDSICEETDAVKVSVAELEEERRTTEARLRFSVPPPSSLDSRNSSSTSSALTFRVYLETLLVGHEDWVTSVQWLPDAMVDQLAGEESSLTDPGAGCFIYSPPAWTAT